MDKHISQKELFDFSCSHKGNNVSKIKPGQKIYSEEEIAALLGSTTKMPHCIISIKTILATNEKIRQALKGVATGNPVNSNQ